MHQDIPADSSPLIYLQSASARCRVLLPPAQQIASRLSHPQLLSVHPQIELAQLRQQWHGKVLSQPGLSQACPSQPTSRRCPSRQGWRWPESSSVPGALATRQPQQVLVRLGPSSGRSFQQQLVAMLA